MGQIHLARNVGNEDNRPAIDHVVDAAEERILALAEDWDGQGSPAFEKQTLDAIRNFLFELVDESELSVVEQVWIVPFSGGSIDLQWQTEHFDLLINFRADGNVTYYGKDASGHSIRGDSRPKPGYISCTFWNGLFGTVGSFYRENAASP